MSPFDTPLHGRLVTGKTRKNMRGNPVRTCGEIRCTCRRGAPYRDPATRFLSAGEVDLHLCASTEVLREGVSSALSSVGASNGT